MVESPVETLRPVESQCKTHDRPTPFGAAIKLSIQEVLNSLVPRLSLAWMQLLRVVMFEPP